MDTLSKPNRRKVHAGRLSPPYGRGEELTKMNKDTHRRTLADVPNGSLGHHGGLKKLGKKGRSSDLTDTGRTGRREK